MAATGGSAYAYASGTDSAGNANVSANSTGGQGGQTGTATSLAAANVTGAGTATADAYAQGSSGSSATMASATRSGGPLLSVQANASTTVTDNRQVESSANFALAGTPSSISGHIGAYGEGLPSQANLPSFGGNPNVNAAFYTGPSAANVQALGAGTLGGGGNGRSFTSSENFTLSAGALNGGGGGLKVGLLGSSATGAGFEYLYFDIALDGLVVTSQQFTSLSAAEAFFNDRILNLGQITGDGSGNATVSFELDVTGTGIDADNFSASFVFGNQVPEPSVAWLVCFGAGGLALGHLVRRRRRRRSDEQEQTEATEKGLKILRFLC